MHFDTIGLLFDLAIEHNLNPSQPYKSPYVIKLDRTYTPGPRPWGEIYIDYENQSGMRLYKGVNGSLDINSETEVITNLADPNSITIISAWMDSIK